MTFKNLLCCALLLFGCWTAHGQSVRQITHNLVDEQFDGAIDDTGSRVVAISSADPLGTNPTHTRQVFAWDFPGALVSQVTHLDKGVWTPDVSGGSLSITDDGATVAFISTADPLGSNADASFELFVAAVDGSSISQLTDVPSIVEGSVLSARISGSGNRIVFMGDIDPLGSNPSNRRQVFVVNPDGTGLSHIGAATEYDYVRGISISDDGARVAFSASAPFDFQILGAPTDTGIVTSFTSSSAQPIRPVLSGDGMSIAYRESGDLLIVPWGGGTPTLLHQGSSDANVSITDDGAWVYFDDGFSTLRVPTAGGPVEFLGFSPFFVSVSGNGDRVVLGGPDPGLDQLLQWSVADADGSNPQQITSNLHQWKVWQPSAAEDTDKLAFLGGLRDGDTDPYPTDGYHVYVARDDGTEQVQLTPSIGARQPAITADGQSVIFESNQDYESNGRIGRHLFRVQTDGTGLIGITPNEVASNAPYALAADTGLIVVESDTAADPLPWGDLYTIPPTGSPLVQLTDFEVPLFGALRVDTSGAWVVFHSDTNFDGLNNNYYTQLFRARTDGTQLERLTSLADRDAIHPDISADGNRIAYSSDADPLGTNPENNYEIFLHEPASGTTTQLTTTTSGRSLFPRLSPDGTLLYFVSTTPFFEDEGLSQTRELYRLEVDTGAIERSGGHSDVRDMYFGWRDDEGYPYSPDGEGGLFLAGAFDATGENADFSGELWHIDFDRPPEMSIGVGSPTELDWDADPRFIRYDVIRGDVANLSDGGGSTDLGPVICLREDSRRSDTVGFGDTQQPTSGQVFFYLYRGTRGCLDGPGSWGEGQPGERFPSLGSCVDN